MSNTLNWSNVTPTVDNKGAMQQAQNQMLQGLHGVENLVKDQERRTDRIISKEKDENSVAALEALLSADVNEVANLDLDQFGRMTSQQKQQLMVAKDVRASELLTRAAQDQENTNKIDDERVKTATNEFWRTHGDEVEALFRDGNEEGAKTHIEAALPDDGRIVSSVWDKYKSRQVAFEKHKETIAENRSRTAIAERSLANTQQSHRDEDISRNVLVAAQDSGLQHRAETHEQQAGLVKVGIDMGVLDDKGNLLPGVNAEDLAEYEKMVSESIDGMGSEHLQKLIDQANRIQDSAKREDTIQQIRQNFMSELELTPEQQKGFIAETEALESAKTLQLTKIENASKKQRKENWAYDAKYDERSTTEKIAKVTEIFKGLGDKATKWEFTNRNELMELVAHGVDIGGGLPHVQVTPEIIEAFVRDRGYREDNHYFTTRWNSAVEARTELRNWLFEPANKRLIVDAEKAYGARREARYGIEQQHLAESKRIQQRIRSAQGFGGGQNLNVLHQQIRGAISNPDVVGNERKIQSEDDSRVKEFISNQLNGSQNPNPERVKELTGEALALANEMGITPSTTETLDAYWENAEKAVMSSSGDNARLAHDLYSEFSTLSRDVKTLETQINSGIERLQINNQIAETESELEGLDASDPRSFSLKPRLNRLRRERGERMKEWSGAPRSEDDLMHLVSRRDDKMYEIGSLESQLKQLLQ